MEPITKNNILKQKVHYYMESDGKVRIPERYDNMNNEEICVECDRLLNEVIKERAFSFTNNTKKKFPL